MSRVACIGKVNLQIRPVAQTCVLLKCNLQIHVTASLDNFNNCFSVLLLGVSHSTKLHPCDLADEVMHLGAANPNPTDTLQLGMKSYRCSVSCSLRDVKHA